jgi:hypothetical protein
MQGRQFLIESVLELLTIVEAAILLNLSGRVLGNITGILKVSGGNKSLGFAWPSGDTHLGLILGRLCALHVLGLS